MNVQEHQHSFISAYHAAAMPARYAVERRQWSEATSLQPRTPEYLPWDEALWPEGLTWFARGLGGVHSNNLVIAQEAETRLEGLRDEAKKAGEENFANYIEIDRRILSGWIEWAEGDADEAQELIRSAADLEKRVEKDPTTPGSLMPSNEALGILLMNQDHAAEALQAYQESEKIWPGRYNTILGAARAAVAAGNKDASKAYYRQLLEVAGDSQRSGVTEAAEYFGR